MTTKERESAGAIGEDAMPARGTEGGQQMEKEAHGDVKEDGNDVVARQGDGGEATELNKSGKRGREEEEPKENEVTASVYPLKIGFKTFQNGKQARAYFKELMLKYPLGVAFNEYEHAIVEDLIRKGHEDPSRKFGCGIKRFFVKFNKEFENYCVALERTDGTFDDLGVSGCLRKLCPDLKLVKVPDKKRPRSVFENTKGEAAAAAREETVEEACEVAEALAGEAAVEGAGEEIAAVACEVDVG
eukprot:CAMPEP_0198236826 /NCGR_PEP_ID=MMETSP1446-20131203/2718_1 /TAXON_ID=1461542 ORGANISM="Unidentified sp, Strain CCMP2111" /NCGR_SAMPLE_ID=MMETSP1446 /ASSEMBLY_ACC=CAM_ASM_001112 /LENGTH=243 /DNA_ID=CAMNT_0043918771 /DNA_START=259 /DNA_END=987 /DNA_ORIENTATION=+